ncbi:YciI family protein [Sphaerisporangium perillae]|uniref:YciI family protein n=1 Tax=Sphaerisporangium perillae TaxID=2935860 RepID=UPI00200F25D9|nr:YciI family protein [Sphaerisporangium perillae]
MKYLILIYSNPESRQLWSQLSAEQRRGGLEAYTTLNEALAATGELIVTEALADPTTARRVRVEAGQATATDGPFAEVKELVAGFYLVECDSIDRAVEIAARIPEAAMGLVEVRPVMALSGFEV